MSRKQPSTIYFKSILNRQVKIPIEYIGSNIKTVIQEKLSNMLEGKCSKEGYIKRGTVEIITYSAGVLETNTAIFDVSFKCLICRPVEGMKIKCKVSNVTKAGIRASHYNNIESPIVVFIARDHYFNNPTFVSIKEDDIITTKVIGIRFELNDKHIYVISELLKVKQNKKSKK